MTPLHTPDSPPDILYIMGTGRSGTTMMHVLLSSVPGVTGAGELSHCLQDALLDDRPCSCGTVASRCDVWLRVSRSVASVEPDIRTAAAWLRNLDWHTAFFRTLTGPPQTVLERYRQLNLAIFTSIAGSDRMVVDSSKYPSRALMLHHAFPGRIKTLCMTRHPSGLIASFQRANANEQKPKALLSAIAYILWMIVVLRIASLRLAASCLIVRYEDLVTDPRRTLTAIGRWSGLDLEPVATAIENQQSFAVGHLVTANRLRKLGRVTLTRDDTGPRGFASRLAGGFLGWIQRGVGL